MDICRARERSGPPHPVGGEQHHPQGGPVVCAEITLPVGGLFMRRETTWARQGQIKQVWRVIDATDVSLGRLAAEVAEVLMGKHRPEYTPHVPSGDVVIVLHGTKIGMTGSKGTQKLKRHYTGYPGGLKAETYESVRARKPDALIGDAVRRMLPKNRLSRVLLKNLHVVPAGEHPFADKKPVTMTI